jgi:putative spermidine/putrescine transport system ATP-binding protein
VSGVKKFNKLLIKDLSKSFGRLKVLNDFNLVVAKGEFVTFLGPSGCGKSTALNCISGLIQITGGEIYVDDECLDDSKRVFVPPEKRGFGIVFQNYALFPHLTVYKNVAFGLEIMKLSPNKISEKVQETLRMVHLEEYANKYPTQLSGGQQQRVAIARCAVMEPRLLLLDEPLSNLDAKLRVEMRYELKQVHERLGISTIYVTHDQQEALALSDRIVVLKIGEIQQIGTPEEIYKNPANQFVADFMGFKNMWPAKIKKIVESGVAWEIVVDVNGVEFKSRRNLSEGSELNNQLIMDAYKKNEEVVTAIRPEDLLMGAAAANTLGCTIRMVEYLGTICQITAILTNGLKMTARHAFRVNIGDVVSYNVPPEKLAIFPKEKVDTI